MKFFLVFALALMHPLARAATTPPPTPWEKEIGAFESSDKTNPPPSGAVVFVGSSSIRFWSSLAHDFSPIPVINRGFGGSQMSDAAAFVDRIVLPYKPRAVVLYSGDNDLATGKTPEVVFAAFQQFVARVRSGMPEVPILLIGVKPSPSRWALKEKMIVTNGLLEDACRKGKNLRFIDVFTPMLGADGQPKPELFREDKLHMQPSGYEIWTRLVRPVLQEILPK